MGKYHWHRAGAGLLLGDLEVEERPVLLGMLKIQLVEATDAGQQDAIVKLLHIAPSLQHHGGIGRGHLLGWERLCADRALGDVIERHDRFGLLAPDLLLLEHHA